MARIAAPALKAMAMNDTIRRTANSVSNTPADASTRNRKVCHFNKTAPIFAMNTITCRTNGFIGIDWNMNGSYVPEAKVNTGF